MSTIYITDHIFAGRPPALTGMRLTVQYDGVTAEVLLQGFDPLSESSRVLRFLLKFCVWVRQ